MSHRKTIVVFGATGAQGGSVANHLLRDRRFDVRCVSRDPASEKSANLKQVGAQVVRGDFDDPASLRDALDGAWGVFGVTNYWEHFDKERAHGFALVDAIADTHGVHHAVLSTLPPVRSVTGGALNVPHFDIKAEIEEHARQRKLPATFVHVAFYYDNFLTFFPPRPQIDGTLAFGFPQGETPLAAVGVEDVGGVVSSIFDHSADYLGRTVGVVGDDQPPSKYAEIMARVLGRTVVYHHIPRETFAAFEFPGAADLADMFEFNRTHIPNRQADLEECRRLYPDLKNFEQWLEVHRDRFRHVVAA